MEGGKWRGGRREGGKWREGSEGREKGGKWREGMWRGGKWREGSGGEGEGGKWRREGSGGMVVEGREVEEGGHKDRGKSKSNTNY